jgi:aminopeptidase-like protein
VVVKAVESNKIYNLCETLFPICRSITGNGVRQTLKIIQDHLPGIQIHEVPTGTRAFDWTVPKEWNIKDAYVIDPEGQKIIDFKESNLHVVGYSIPVDQTVPLEELQQHLYSLPDQPGAIPYVTSYYKERWGFCLTENQRESLKPGQYKVYIDSTLTEGSLTYGEIVIPGTTEQEIFISTYICHPSMANNELSGPAVTAFLGKWLQGLDNRKYTYRIIFIPETIGSIVYLSRNLETLKKNVIAGFNITCIGDNRAYSYLPSRYGDTLADRAAKHALGHLHPDYITYSYLDRGSDERQYCSPGVDLPVVSVMRTKYGQYPEYHTSLDNLNLVSPEGLQGGYEVLQKCIECLERNETLAVTVPCEPQLGKRGLYPTISMKKSGTDVRDMMNLLAYCDGSNDILQVADLIKKPAWDLYDIANKLKDNDLLTVIK